jgi:nitronate monooxygenase
VLYANEDYRVIQFTPSGSEASREFLSRWGPPVPEGAGDITLQNFDEQCEALLRIAPAAVSSIMSLYPPSFVAELKSRRIFWFATATTVAETKQAEAAGADVIVAQGMEAGGHRGAFDATKARLKKGSLGGIKVSF